jgi:hypothetical protein
LYTCNAVGQLGTKICQNAEASCGYCTCNGGLLACSVTDNGTDCLCDPC